MSARILASFGTDPDIIGADDGADDVVEAILALAKHEGARSIKDLPGCWECRVDEQWFVAVNGHKTPTKTTADDSGAVDVPPFHAFVTFNGWVAACFALNSKSLLFAHGEAANATTFVAAVKARIARGGS
jgi:hypothetical protein